MQARKPANRFLFRNPVLPPLTSYASLTGDIGKSEQPPIHRQLQALSKMFIDSPLNIKIIAVQATCDDSTRFIAQFLAHHIQKDLGLPVRVFSGLPPADGHSDYVRYLHPIRTWHSICEFVTTSPPPLIHDRNPQTLMLVLQARQRAISILSCYRR